MSTAADRESRLRELAAANVAVGSQSSLEDVLQKTADVAARLVDARYGALGVLDRTGAHLEHLVTSGMDETTRAQIGRLPSDHGILRILLREARPVRVADVTKEPQFFGFPRSHPRMRSFLGVPILVRGVVYGDLYLAEKKTGEFTESDQEIVTLLAAQTGLTIEKVQIHEGATHWLRQLEALDELTRSVLEERDVLRLLELVARRLRELIGARGVLISLPASTGDLRVVVADGEDLDELVGYDVPPESRHARTFTRGKSERIDSVLADPEVDQVLAGRIGAVAALFIPLIIHDRAIGVMYAFNKDGPDPHFTDDDVRLAEALGTRAALAVHLSERVARETVDAILEAQEAERGRIARELHDETGAALTAILLDLTTIDEAATLADARHASAALRQNARSALENVGRLAFSLRPPALDEFGLASALRDLSNRLEERGGPKVELTIELPAGMRLPAKLETAIFRITQEALTNAVKHADAKTVHVSLALSRRSVTLAVEDDGRGFPQARADVGFGLIGIRERVASANGALDIESESGRGTRLAIELPLPDKE
ncbi:MAG TPA: GAF domain-containing protein [Gaiellaceae bacterium]|nr:GAF domain-containing protein [Gaiellaceae bacterium]